MIDQNKLIRFHLFLALIILLFAPQIYAYNPSYIASGRYVSTGVIQISTAPFYNVAVNYLGNYVVTLGSCTRTNQFYQVGLAIHSLNFYFNINRLSLDMKVTSKTTTSFNLQFSSPMAYKLQLLKVCYITKDFAYTDPFYVVNFRSLTTTQNLLITTSSPQNAAFTLPTGITSGTQKISFFHGFDFYALLSVPNVDFDIFLSTSFPSSTQVQFTFSTNYDDVKLDFYSITVVFYSNVNFAGVTTSQLSRFTNQNAGTSTTASALSYTTSGGTIMTSQTLFIGMNSFHVDQIGPAVDWINFETILTSSTQLDFISTNNFMGNFIRFQFLIIQSWKCIPGDYLVQFQGDCKNNNCPPSLVMDPTHTMCILICPITITHCIKCKLQGSNTICQICQYGYTYVTGSSNCQPVCGDGIYLNGLEDCQDGNTVAGDGCDATCLIEPTYKCPINPITGISACYIPPPLYFTLAYQYTIKQPSSNQVYMYIAIEPSDQAYSQLYSAIDWNAAIVSNLTTSTYSYQYISSPKPHLKLTMGYTQNLNNKNIQFQIQPYSPTIYPAEYYQITLMTLNVNNLQAINNMDLNVYDQTVYGITKVGNVIAWVLAAIYMFMFVGGMIIGKVYLLQLSVAAQLAYLSLISLTYPPPTFYSLIPLKYIFGYSYTPSPYISSFSFSSQSPLTQPEHNFMQFSPYFIQNYNIMFILIVLSLLANLYLYFKYRNVEFTSRRKRVQVDKLKIFFFNDLPMYLVIWFAFLVLSAGQIQFQYLGIDIFGNAVTYLGIVFFIVNVLLFCAYFYLYFEQYLRFTSFQQLFSTIRLFIPFKQRNISQHFYYLIFIQKVIISIILVQVPGSSYMNLIIACENIIIIVILIVIKPYRNYQLKDQTQTTTDDRNFNNRQIFNYSICCIIQILFLITNCFQFNQENLWLLYFPIIIQLLLFVQIIVTIYFIIQNGRFAKDFQQFKLLIENVDQKVGDFVDFNSTTKGQQINQTKADIVANQNNKILQKHLNGDLKQHIRKIQLNQLQDSDKQINILDFIMQKNRKNNLTPLQIQNISTKSKNNTNNNNQHSFFKSLIQNQDIKRNNNNNFDTNNNNQQSFNNSKVQDITMDHNSNNLNSNRDLNRSLNSNLNSNKNQNSKYDSQQGAKSIRHKQILKSLKPHLVTVNQEWLNYQKVNSQRFRALQSTLINNKK